MSSSTVYIIHPDPEIRESVRSIAANMQVHCNTFASTRELIETNHHDWACVLACAPANDVNRNGADSVSQNNAQATPMVVVLSSAARDNARIVHPLRLDPSTSTNGTEASKLEDLLRQGLQAADQQRLSSERQARAKRERDAISQRLDRLTDSERAVLDRVLEGQLNKMIARNLDVSVRTVEQRRRNIMTKMEADSLADLVGQVTRLHVYSELLD